MLNNLMSSTCPPSPDSDYQKRWKRDEKQDIRDAIEELFKLTACLQEMHPSAENVIRAILRSQLC